MCRLPLNGNSRPVPFFRLSLWIEECRATRRGPYGENGARASVSDGICPRRSTMRAGTWSVPASWSTSQMAARKSRESEPTQSPMSSGCARPLATVDPVGSFGVLTIRWASSSLTWPMARTVRASRPLCGSRWAPESCCSGPKSLTFYLAQSLGASRPAKRSDIQATAASALSRPMKLCPTSGIKIIRTLIPDWHDRFM
jgi:hypothetical protein